MHGAFHGPWCWSELTPPLRAAGHEVRTPDLRAPDTAGQLADATGDVVLVGHSSGGMVVSALAERPPLRISAPVYVSAFLLPPGVGPPSLGPDPESLMGRSLEVDEERGTDAVRPEQARELLFGECTASTADWAVSRLTPEPVGSVGRGPVLDGLPVVAQRETPRRFYVECLQDKALGPPVAHSPFPSMPAELAAHLLDVAARSACGMS